MWVPPADARAFTDYRPSCMATAQLAHAMKARTYGQFRAALVQPGAYATVQRFIAAPRPGDTHSVNTYPTAGQQPPSWSTSTARKACQPARRARPPCTRTTADASRRHGAVHAPTP